MDTVSARYAVVPRYMNLPFSSTGSPPVCICVGDGSCCCSCCSVAHQDINVEFPKSSDGGCLVGNTLGSNNAVGQVACEVQRLCVPVVGMAEVAKVEEA
jgi:hypothetical protein